MKRSVCQSWLGLARSKRRGLSGCGLVGDFFQFVAGLVQHPGDGAGLAGRPGPRRSMALMRSTPQSGLACLSMRMVRLVRSGKPAALGTPARLVHQAGRAFGSNFFFQAYRVCREADQGAKSRAGRPLRCQASRMRSRCSASTG